MVCAILFAGASSNSHGAIVFTEIHYNAPEAGVDQNEFIELTNTGSATMNMLGYALIWSGNTKYVFGDVNLRSMESILVTGQPDVLTATSGKTIGQIVYNIPASTQIFQWSASSALGNSSATISLKTSASAVDSVATLSYTNASPWPGGTANGQGASIEIIDVNAAAPYEPGNWRAGEIGGSPGYLAAVPEPSAALLGSLTALGLLRRRR